MLGHVEVDNAPAMVGEHNEDEEDPAPSGGHGEEIERDHGELLTQGEVLQGKLSVAAAHEWEESEQREQEGDHRAGIFSGSEPIDQPLGCRPSFGEGQVTAGLRQTVIARRSNSSKAA